jgi:F-type H+-transporting ATPase subunit b
MMANPIQTAEVQTGPSGAVVEHAETLQTALVEHDSTVHHPAEVTWLGFGAAGWVSLAMLILIGLMIWKKVPQAIGRGLDGYTARVKADLDEAARLRKEAEDLLANYQAEAREAVAQAKEILSNAKAEAERVVSDAKTHAEETVARRTRLAEEKIAAAERAAADDLRARAADMAVEAARKTIRSQADTPAHKKLTDQAISELDRRLH